MIGFVKIWKQIVAVSSPPFIISAVNHRNIKHDNIYKNVLCPLNHHHYQQWLRYHTFLSLHIILSSQLATTWAISVIILQVKFDRPAVSYLLCNEFLSFLKWFLKFKIYKLNSSFYKVNKLLIKFKFTTEHLHDSLWCNHNDNVVFVLIYNDCVIIR